MFSKIKNAVLSKICERYTKDMSKNFISFLFARIFIFFMLVVINCIMILVFHKFGINITRRFMLVYITCIELFIIYLLKKYSFYQNTIYSGHSNLSKSIQMENYYTNLSLVTYQSLLYNIFLALPFLIAYGCYNNASIVFYINSVFSVLSLSIVTSFLNITLAKYSIGKNKILNAIGSTLMYTISFISYVFVYLFIEINVGINMLSSVDIEFYRQLCSFFNEIIRFLRTPADMLRTGRTDLVNMPLVFVEFSIKNLFNIMIISGMIIVFFELSEYLIKILVIKKKEKLQLKNKLSKIIRNNNTKVFRLNHTLRYCMPHSPPSLK